MGTAEGLSNTGVAQRAKAGQSERGMRRTEGGAHPMEGICPLCPRHYLCQ